MKRQYARHASARMFDNPLLEWGSRIHPAVPGLFYGPLVVGMLAWGLRSDTTGWGWVAAMFPAGVLTWQVMEYALHRYFFHWEGSGPFTRRLHYIIHGYHHEYPDDPQRLVMPLGASVPLALVIIGLLWLVHAPQATLPYFAGIVTGYLAYDYMHWAVHYLPPRTQWGKTMRAHHMAHHFNTPDKNYGISHRWLDVVVGTLRERPARNA